MPSLLNFSNYPGRSEDRKNALHYSRFPGLGLSSGNPDNEPGIVPTHRCVSRNDNIKVGLNQI
jgi:hypothetical protein